MHNLYFYILFFSVLFPFIFSFHPKIAFYKTWKYLFPAMLITAFVFVVWDIYFTKEKVWGFNKEYILNIYFFNLPIEEVLFFLCIPFSSIFIYHIIEQFPSNNVITKSQNKITYFLLLFLLILGIINIQKAYTATTFISLFLFLGMLKFIFNASFLGKFYYAYLYILIPFLIVNGILTGSYIKDEVVWYDNQENLGLRIFTIPIEDAFYGMLLLILSISIYEYFRKKKFY